MSGAAGAQPWAWLGLLKWSLSYSDGTRDNSDISPMSKEDREFLEKVMAEGIIDEGERMKFILQEATKAMEYYRSKADAKTTTTTESKDDSEEDAPISNEDLEDLLQELRDIVEQIDYARAFCSLQGLPFLIGCMEDTEGIIPENIRMMCGGILSTLCQNNPPVQKQLLELGAIKSLSDAFFQKNTSMKMKAKIMQAISSIVRNHELAEQVFCSLDQAQALFAEGLNKTESSAQLRSRTLFFLRALVTSDAGDSKRSEQFEPALSYVAENYLGPSMMPPDLRELAVEFLEQLWQQERAPKTIVARKQALVGFGVQRIAALRSLEGEEKEFAAIELERWESFLVALARS